MVRGGAVRALAVVLVPTAVIIGLTLLPSSLPTGPILVAVWLAMAVGVELTDTVRGRRRATAPDPQSTRGPHDP